MATPRHRLTAKGDAHVERLVLATLTRHQLCKQVWTTPLSRLAHTFQRSATGLAKACSDAGIPVPGQGYWTVRRAGLPAPRRAMRKGLDPDKIVITYHPSNEPPPPPKPPPPRPRPQLDEDLDQLRAAIEGAGPMPAPDDLSAALPVVKRTRTALRGAIAMDWQEHGLLHARDEGSLSLQISEASIDRALRFFDGLIRATIGFGAKLPS